MEGALNAFPVSAEGKVCLDIGASTGGFTDCLLQHGAVKVHAIDVGTNQLVWKLRQDPRVVVKEKFNARYMTPEDIGEQVDLIVSDVSFISLKKSCPRPSPCLRTEGTPWCSSNPSLNSSRKTSAPAASSGTRSCTSGRWTPYAPSSRKN